MNQSLKMPILSQIEIKKAQAIIDQHSFGIYELKAIYGEEWQHIASPTSFGKKFKNTVAAKLLNNIEHYSLQTDNHNMYRIQR